MYLEAEVFSKEYLFTIHYLFVISNNILAHGLEFRGDPYSRGGLPKNKNGGVSRRANFGPFFQFFKRTSIGLLIAPCFRSRKMLQAGGLLLSVACL